MIKRKQKIIFTQISLFIIGVLIIFFTYFNKKQSELIIFEESNQEIKNKFKEQDQISNDIFYNIKYSGIDLSGNRYALTSKEAVIDQNNPEIINMRYVEANFYFKDDTILNVVSSEGVYNNKNLNIFFKKNVVAKYGESKLFADKAHYSNVDSFIEILDNVIVSDQKGTVFADKLLFDVIEKNLKIISLNDNKINAKINLK